MSLLLLEDGALDATLIVGLVVFAVLVAGGVLLLHLAGRLDRQADELASLRRLEAIEGLLRQVVEREDELDLRRLEHVLIDLRDGQRRLEERLMGLLEARSAPRAEPVHDFARPGSLGERVTTRLLAMGFEHIDVLTSFEELEALQAAGEGEVLVEARRAGARHKGRVLLKDGAIGEVKLRDSYEAFP